MEGWIQLSRRLLEWEYFNDELMLRGWLYLLLKANHDDKVWRGLRIKRGQYVTSLSKMAKDLDISIQQTRRILDTLKSTYEIASCATNKFTIISICKYEYYQGDRKKKQQTKEQADEQALQHEHQQALQQQLNNIIKNKEKKNIPSNEGKSVDTPDPKTEETVDFDGLIKFFNNTMASNNSVIPKIVGISEKRKQSVRARVREHSKRAVFEVITKAGASDFLNGRNKNGWVADFDWIFRPNNFPKVLEGNYDNRPNTQINGNNRTSTYQEQRAAELTKLAGDYSAIIARRLAEDDARH